MNVLIMMMDGLDCLAFVEKPEGASRARRRRVYLLQQISFFVITLGLKLEEVIRAITQHHCAWLRL